MLSLTKSQNQAFMPIKKAMVHSSVLFFKLTNAEALFMNDLPVLLFMCQKMRQTQLTAAE